MDIETRLRQDLAGRAQDIDAAPADLLDAVLHGHRQQRRRRGGALGAAVVAVLAAVTVPLVVTGGPSPTPPAAPAAPTTAARPAVPYDLPPRGSLADDPRYLQELLDRPWGRGPDALDPDARQVVFAGEVPGGVQALVIGREGGEWVGMWLHGPAGTAPADLEPTNEPGPIDPALPLRQYWTVDGAGALVVVARPGDVVEVSPWQDVRADGTIARRPYETVGDADGIAVLDAADVSATTSDVRVTRDGRPVTGWGGDGGGGVAAVDPPLDLGAAVAEAQGTPDPDLVRQLLEMVLTELDLATDEVEVGVLWGGPIEPATALEAAAALFTVRLPSGATVLAGGYGLGDPGPAAGLSMTGTCLTTVLPAGTGPAGVVATTCEVPRTSNGPDRALQLVALLPTGTETVELLDGAGAVLEVHAASGPALSVGAPDGLAAVRTRDGAGAVLAEDPVRGLEQLRLP